MTLLDWLFGAPEDRSPQPDKDLPDDIKLAPWFIKAKRRALEDFCLRHPGVKPRLEVKVTRK